MIKSSDKYTDLVQNLNDGKICIFETDTVVGIACKIFLQNSSLNSINPNVKRIFNIKKRDLDKSLPWLISSKKMLLNYASNISNWANSVIEECWPGKTTLIFYSKENWPQTLSQNTNKKNTIAFRIPNCDEIINAINTINCPLACTSANFSGENALSDIREVNQKFLDKADFVYTHKLHTINSNNKASRIISCLDKNLETIRS